MRLDATHNSQLTTYNSRFGSLYLTRHRLYSPVLRRFLSADPLGIDGGLNLYAYANGDPLAYIDPLGLCASDGDGWTRIGGFFQMIGGAAESALGYGFAVASAETGLGIAAGLAVGIHGSDVATAGFYTMVNGVPQDTLTSQGLQSIGVPQDWANGIDAGVSMAGTMGVGMVPSGIDTSTHMAINDSIKIPVSHWGSQEIQPGSYVVMGENSFFNYFRSGKWQPGFGNQFASPKSGFTVYVSPETLKAPSKAASASSIFDSFLMDPIKGGLFGQRSYWGPAIRKVP